MASRTPAPASSDRGAVLVHTALAILALVAFTTFVVDYGVNLAEVTEMVRSRVAYEIERHTGLPVKAVDVHVDSARRAE